MPLQTIPYTCSHKRELQGAFCSCFYGEIMRINDPAEWQEDTTGFVPFDYVDCHHNKTARRRHECRDCRKNKMVARGRSAVASGSK